MILPPVNYVTLIGKKGHFMHVNKFAFRWGSFNEGQLPGLIAFQIGIKQMSANVFSLKRF